MIRTVREHRIGTVFVLCVFVVFAFSVLMVLMLGASTYSNITEMSREQQAERTVLSYVWTKVRNSDENGNIYIGEFNSLPALHIDEDIGGVIYRTVIYHYEGWVYELFSDAELDFMPIDGVRLIQTTDLRFEGLDLGLIRVSSGTRSLLLSPRSSALEVGTGADNGEEVIIG